MPKDYESALGAYDDPYQKPKDRYQTSKRLRFASLEGTKQLGSTSRVQQPAFPELSLSNAQGRTMRSRKVLEADSTLVQDKRLTTYEINQNLIQQATPIEPTQTMGTFAYPSSAFWQLVYNIF